MHVYISHSRVNSSSALRLCEELRTLDIDTWLDVRDLEPGAEWDPTVSAAIERATAFVFVIGPPGTADRWQTYEWQQIVSREYYLDVAKPLIPVLIGNPEIPGFLKTRQTLVMPDGPGACHDLAKAVVNLLNNPASSVDEKKIELGLEARRQALKSLQEYSHEMEQKDLSRAGIRGME